MKQTFYALVMMISLVACATTPSSETEEANAEGESSATQVALDKTEAGLGDAALSPLEDVNLKRDEIPEYLKTIKNPYEVPFEISCGEIAAEVLVLDGILGRDWDVPPPDKKSMQERAADGASTAFLDTVASTTSGFIPFRGVVRSLSGADSHAKKVRKAYERGSHRRTFLKGLGLAKGCGYPAAPQKPEEEVSKITYK